MLDPITLLRLGQVVHEDRLREMEQERLARQVLAAQPAPRKPYAPLLAALGERMVMLGQRMQSPANRQRRHA